MPTSLRISRRSSSVQGALPRKKCCYRPSCRRAPLGEVHLLLVVLKQHPHHRVAQKIRQSHDEFGGDKGTDRAKNRKQTPLDLRVEYGIIQTKNGANQSRENLLQTTEAEAPHEEIYSYGIDSHQLPPFRKTFSPVDSSYPKLSVLQKNINY